MFKGAQSVLQRLEEAQEEAKRIQDVSGQSLQQISDERRRIAQLVRARTERRTQQLQEEQIAAEKRLAREARALRSPWESALSHAAQANVEIQSTLEYLRLCLQKEEPPPEELLKAVRNASHALSLVSQAHAAASMEEGTSLPTIKELFPNDFQEEGAFRAVQEMVQQYEQLAGMYDLLKAELEREKRMKTEVFQTPVPLPTPPRPSPVRSRGIPFPPPSTMHRRKLRLPEPR